MQQPPLPVYPTETPLARIVGNQKSAVIHLHEVQGTEYAFLAEDCVQEAILQAYQQRASFESAFFFKAYLYTCIRNRAVSILRKSHAQETYLAEQDEAGTDLVNDFIREEVLNQLYNAIRELPAEHRRLFELSYEQGLKNAEVAAILQVSESTVSRCISWNISWRPSG